MPTPLQRGDLRARARDWSSRGREPGRDRAALRERPRGAGARRARRGDRLRQRVHGLRGRGHLPLGLPDRPPLRLRACCRSRASRRSSSRARRATSASTARRGSRSRSSSTARATGSPTGCAGKRVGVYGLDYVMTVARLRGARRRGRARALGRRSSTTRARSRATTSSSRCATASASTPTASGRLPRGLRAGRSAEREMLAPCEELLRRAGLRAADDGHGARRGAPSSRSRAPTTIARRRSAPVARDRRPRRPLGRGLARDLPASRATR